MLKPFQVHSKTEICLIDRENLALFTDEFATDTMRNMGWKAFLKKIRWKEQIDFSVVMKCIKENLQVYWDKKAW